MHEYSKHTQWQSDLYDANPPLSPFESYMRKVGFSKVLRPKDLAIKKYLDLYVNEKTTLLDVGCAAGVFTQRVSKTYGAKCTGIDISQVLLAKAQSEDPQNTYLRADASHLPFPDNHFDIVTSFDNLEHIKEYREVIVDMVRVLKPGGKIILNTINRNHKYTFDWLLEKMGSTYHLERAGHVKELFFEPSEIKMLFEQAGLTNVKIRLFDATFVLIMDCISYIFLMIMETLGNIIKQPTATASIATTITTIITKASASALEKCDKVITVRGYSNAFFLIGEKPIE